VHSDMQTRPPLRMDPFRSSRAAGRPPSWGGSVSAKGLFDLVSITCTPHQTPHASTGHPLLARRGCAGPAKSRSGFLQPSPSKVAVSGDPECFEKRTTAPPPCWRAAGDPGSLRPPWLLRSVYASDALLLSKRGLGKRLMAPSWRPLKACSLRFTLPRAERRPLLLGRLLPPLRRDERPVLGTLLSSAAMPTVDNCLSTVALVNRDVTTELCCNITTDGPGCRKWHPRRRPPRSKSRC